MSFPLSAASYQVLVPCFSDIARRGAVPGPWAARLRPSGWPRPCLARRA